MRRGSILCWRGRDEFVPNPDGTDSGNEWIELYNGDASIDLQGWSIERANQHGQRDGRLTPHKCLSSIRT